MEEWASQESIRQINLIFDRGIDLFKTSTLAPAMSESEYDELPDSEPVRLEWRFGEGGAERSARLHEEYRNWLSQMSAVAFRYLPSVGSKLLESRSLMDSYITLNRFAMPKKENLEEVLRLDDAGFVGIYLAEWENLRETHLRAIGQLEMVEQVISQQLEERKGILVEPIFASRAEEVMENRAFVLMPFSQLWSGRVYRVLTEILETAGLSVTRADELTGMDVMEDVWKGILSSQIVIADLTSRNPNVFYELGMAHVVGKKVILLTQSIDDVPFDLRRFRLILYEDNLDGYDELRRSLNRMLLRTRGSTPQPG